MNEHLFQIKEISSKIVLNPQYCNKDYENILLDILKNKYENISMKNVGYIKKVYEIVDKKQEIMKIIPSISFVCVIKVLVYLPQINDELEINVDFIFNHGIFGYFEKIKILIPLQYCDDWELHQDFSSVYMKNKNNGELIKVHSKIKIKILNIRFEKDNFSCLATILHNLNQSNVEMV
jgi:DNA-directed RNA polymerase subunit E'/Rpb7